MQADLRYKRASEPFVSLDHNPTIDLVVVCQGVFWYSGVSYWWKGLSVECDIWLDYILLV